jgi:RNA polymerase sigma factor (TIGR02999 family)
VGKAGESVTQLLQKWRAGDAKALDEVARLVYAELHRLAAAYLRRERGNHTLQPTALVAEAYLRLCDAGAGFENRSHFLAIAARSMRRVLIDYARKRAAEKRGGAPIPVTFDESLATSDRPEMLVALDDALTELARVDPRKAQIVELVYFGGLGQSEVAELLQVHRKTVARDLRLVEAWLKSQLLEKKD